MTKYLLTRLIRNSADSDKLGTLNPEYTYVCRKAMLILPLSTGCNASALHFKTSNSWEYCLGVKKRVSVLQGTVWRCYCAIGCALTIFCKLNFLVFHPIILANFAAVDHNVSRECKRLHFEMVCKSQDYENFDALDDLLQNVRIAYKTYNWIVAVLNSCCSSPIQKKGLKLKVFFCTPEERGIYALL